MSYQLPRTARPGPRARSGRLAQRKLLVGLVVIATGALVPSIASAITQPASIPNAAWDNGYNPAAVWPPTASPDWPVPAANPALTARCGVDIAVLVDRSASIFNAGQAANYRTAVKDMIDAFAGTPSNLGVWSFGERASDTDAVQYPWHQMTQLDGAGGPANVTALKATVDIIPFTPNQSTNWEEGIRAVQTAPVAATPAPDLLVVLTDGEPTVHADDLGANTVINNDDMAGGVASANLLKAAGTRVLAVGVGPSVTVPGLQLISGPTAFNGTNISTADYLTTSFADLNASLRSFATAICGGSVTVTKEASTPAAPATFAPAAGWTLSGVIANPPPSATAVPAQPATAATDDGVTGIDGRVTFGWTSLVAETITVTEAPQPGFVLVARSCTLGGAPFPFTNVADGMTLTVSQGQQVECTLRNQASAAAPAPAPAPGSVDLTVTKTNSATSASPGDTVRYAIGYRNAGTALATGVTLTETVPAHTTFDAAASDPGWDCNGAAPGDGDAAPAGSTCTLDVGDLAPSATFETVVFAVVIDDPLPAGVSRLTNTVVIDGTNEDDDDLPNTATDDDAFDAGPDLTVVKDDGGVTAERGDEVTYRIDYANNGSRGATDVLLSETVPEGTTFVGPSDWVCTGRTCVFIIGDLAAGARGSIDFTVRIDDDLPAGQTSVRNVVVIEDTGANGPDQNPADNDDEDTTELRQPAQVLPGVIERPAPASPEVRAQALPRTGQDSDQLVLLAGLLTMVGGLFLVGESVLEQRRIRERG